MLDTVITNFNVGVATVIQRQGAWIKHIYKLQIAHKMVVYEREAYTTQNLSYPFYYKMLFYQKWTHLFGPHRTSYM